ncbi:hypothetical protein FGADI_10794 [Fusarium gaditjirri]|uniref:Major facilitator superfamily (MFS) profile domain-containing protein n=1 Tax=Fusarium gaditjirri TaxID=282569 RepID=A0A8H4SWK4_9HYPO|nr:hypothetical protein FGADI_10794 [Fusarium gaditjirri]
MDSATTKKAEVARVENTSRAPSTPADQELRDHPKAGISAGLAALMYDFRSNYDKAGDIVAYSVLCIGLGSFIWIPTAVVIGKRPVLLASQVILLGARILGAFGAGAVQAVGPAVVGGILGENYSKAMGLYAVSLCIGAQGGPLIAGHLIEAKGWSWFFILLALLSGFSFLTLAFFCPKTAFNVEIEAGATSADVDADILDQTTGLGRTQSSITTWKQILFT